MSGSELEEAAETTPRMWCHVAAAAAAGSRCAWCNVYVACVTACGARRCKQVLTGLSEQMRQMPGAGGKYTKAAREHQLLIYSARIIQRCVHRHWLRKKLRQTARKEARIAARLALLDKIVARLQHRFILRRRIR